ncbi:NADP-dependent oxidoreductase domain-containing protein [Bisporella sp. PMI_857]|nr:NADP-dependent oxidoreductase domain-containing protein [Bisporella sp. PMI_857]
MLTARDCRNGIVIATRHSSVFQLHNEKKIQSNFVKNGSNCLHISVLASLERLQTSYIDILYFHRWDYATDIPEVMYSLYDLVVSGKVLYLGVSEVPTWVVDYVNFLRIRGLGTRRCETFRWISCLVER